MARSGQIDPRVRLEKATPTARGSLRLAATDIKLAHSVFALPFALLAGVLAGPGIETGSRAGAFAGKLVLIVACMFFARTWAMLVNRMVDRNVDALNPRSAGWPVASGVLSLRRVLAMALGSGGLFIVCAALFWAFFGNAWPVILAVPVLAWIAFYSLTKRFTVLCHLFLGSALAVSPIAAAIAVDPSALARIPALWWLGVMVLLWVAGFDVIYALQDMDFDREHGLRSVPARLGWRGALWISRAMHAGTIAALVLVYRVEPRFGSVFLAGVAIVGMLLVVEHAVLVRRGRRGLKMAFFTLNGVVSCVLGAIGIVDSLL